VLVHAELLLIGSGLASDVRDEPVICHYVLENIMRIMSLVALCVVVGDLIRRDAGVLEVTAHSCWLTADEV